jgi:hyperosmotically inducible periplasmic protein
MRNVVRAVITLGAFLVVSAGCAAPKATTPAPAESGRQSVHDASITAAIKTAFIERRLGTVTEIRVMTSHGRVVLSGTVESEQQKQRAGAIARQIDGVREVVNELRVTPGD